MPDLSPQFPGRYEARLAELERAYSDAQSILAMQVRSALASGELDKIAFHRTQLNSAVHLLDLLGHETDPFAAAVLRQAYDESVEWTGDLIVSAGVDTPVSGAFGRVSANAVIAMQRSMLGRLDDARRTIGRRIEDVYARAGRRSVMLGLLGAAGNRPSVTAKIVYELLADGMKSFVDRGGREWDLRVYARMVARTTTREAVVEGAKARMLAQGVTVARVSVSANPCPVCAKWQGRLVSLDGETSETLGEPVATLDAMPNGGPPFHPNCKHILVPEVASIEGIRRELGGVA